MFLINVRQNDDHMYSAAGKLYIYLNIQVKGSINTGKNLPSFIVV